MTLSHIITDLQKTMIKGNLKAQRKKDTFYTEEQRNITADLIRNSCNPENDGIVSSNAENKKYSQPRILYTIQNYTLQEMLINVFKQK